MKKNLLQLKVIYKDGHEVEMVVSNCMFSNWVKSSPFLRFGIPSDGVNESGYGAIDTNTVDSFSVFPVEVEEPEN